MKNNGLMQLTVEVGKCIIPNLNCLEYSLTVRLTKDICASTTFRASEGSSVDFATKLFLRVDKAVLEATPTCCVSVTGIGEKASRKEVGKGEAKTSQEGLQRVLLGVPDRPGAFLEATLEFCACAWEPKQTKTNNNRLSNFKSHLSQKQSSSDQKDPQPAKTLTNCALSTELDKKDKSDGPGKFTALKASQSEKLLPDNSCELENSATTTKDSGKTEEGLNKSGDSVLLLNMQMKIDLLEERIAALEEQLQAETERTRSVCISLEEEKARNLHLEGQRQQLSQLLTLEEEKSTLCMRHIQRLTRLVQSLGDPSNLPCALIQEKDEIILLNEELEDELASKNQTIGQMKGEIDQLKQRIILLEAAKSKAPQVPEKGIVQKKGSQKIITPVKKVEERRLSQKELDKKEIKNDAGSKKPVVPKNPREVRSPTGIKTETTVKGVKSKAGRPKEKQKEKGDEKRSLASSMFSVAQGDATLLLNSRSHEEARVGP